MNLPPPAADELGYNLLCRHADLWGHLEDLGLWQAWTAGEATHRQCIEVVAGCRRLARAAYPSIKDAERHFVRNHTLLPYFTAFMRRGQRTAALGEIAGATPSVSRLLHGVLRQTSHLRFCTDCANEQVLRLGFSYWTRTAQLPGLSYCPWHGSSLKQTDISPEMTRSTDRLQSLDRAVRVRTYQVSPVLMHRRLEARIASHSLWALRSGLGRGEPVSVAHYRRNLFQAGYRNRRGDLSTSLFQEDFRRWLNRRGAHVDAFGSGAWWLRMVTRIGGPTSPLQHMLLQDFIREVNRQQESTQPILLGSTVPTSTFVEDLRQTLLVSGKEQVVPVVDPRRVPAAERGRWHASAPRQQDLFDSQ